MGEKLRGVVERVTYANAENGYSVIRLAVKGMLDLVTVVTGGNYDVNSSSAEVPFGICDDIVYGHVLPAIR